ncbi:MAG: hypothetical protein H7A33_07785 [Deltaproteobacteria bacterium]|nr:hypothetical protein [Deltaproteobacteria bacterium]
MGLILKKYMWVFSLVVTIAISYLLAKTTSLIISGQFNDTVMMVSQSSDEFSFNWEQGGSADIDRILKRNFFDEQETVFEADDTGQQQTQDEADDQEDQTVAQNGKAVKTSLDIQLLSTISVGDGKGPRSSAVIKSRGNIDTYRITSKESFAPSTKIVQILRDRVEFLNSKRLEYVEILDAFGESKMTAAPPIKETASGRRLQVRTPPSEDVVEQEGDTFKIQRAEIDRALANIAKLYTDIRAVPYFYQGKPNGFKLLSVKRGSLFQKLGLRRGDVLKAINGRALDIQSGMTIFNDLKSETKFELVLERRGEEKTFSYEII